MAGPLRIEYEGALYHVTAKRNERREIYFTLFGFDELLTELRRKYGSD